MGRPEQKPFHNLENFNVADHVEALQEQARLGGGINKPSDELGQQPVEEVREGLAPQEEAVLGSGVTQSKIKEFLRTHPELKGPFYGKRVTPAGLGEILSEFPDLAWEEAVKRLQIRFWAEAQFKPPNKSRGFTFH